jgi:ABC-type dipeptide/oligopeptide/nickel transport system ATPase component
MNSITHSPLCNCESKVQQLEYYRRFNTTIIHVTHGESTKADTAHTPTAMKLGRRIEEDLVPRITSKFKRCFLMLSQLRANELIEEYFNSVTTCN